MPAVSGGSWWWCVGAGSNGVGRSVLHSPVRTAVQTVWTGSVQSRPPVFLDWIKTVRPVRGFSGLQSTAKTRILQPGRYLPGTMWDYSYPLSPTTYLDPNRTINRYHHLLAPTKPREWQDRAAKIPDLAASIYLTNNRQPQTPP
jgi:hypothetical protein